MSDVLTGALSWRRLGVLLRQLPLGAATLRQVQGPAAIWSANEHLLAGIYDLLAGANWQRSGGKSSKPKPLPRPGDAEERIGTAIPLEEMRELAKKWRGGELERPDRAVVEVT